MRSNTVRTRLWLGVGVAAVAAVLATGAVGGSGGGAISTMAGTGKPGFSGDGGPASDAQIADPENLWIRGDGSILISVRDNARLRIISPDGIITTFAGRGPTKVHDYFAPISLPPVDP